MPTLAFLTALVLALPVGADRTPRLIPWSGPRPLSEPESRYVVALVRALHPVVTVVFHQHQDVVRAWGRSRATGRRFAQLLDARAGGAAVRPGAARLARVGLVR